MDNVVMNATGYGLTGITNLASQTGTIGSVLGAAVLIGLLVGAVAMSHSWNTRGRIYKLVQWLLKNVGSNFCYGVGTITTGAAIWFIGSTMSQFSESNPHLLSDAILFTGQAAIVIAFVCVVGFITKPIWNFIGDYASGKKQKKVVK